MKALNRILSLLAIFALLGYVSPHSAYATDGGDDEETLDQGLKLPDNNLNVPSGTTTISFVINNDGNSNPDDIVVGLKPPYDQMVNDGTIIIDKEPTGNNGSVQVTIHNINKIPEGGKFAAQQVYLAHDIGITADDLSGKEEKPVEFSNTISDILFFTGGRPETLDNLPKLEYEEVQAIEAQTEVNTYVNDFENFELQAENVKVFPNPSAGLINVNIQSDVKVSQINVVNVVGQVVYTEQVPQTQNTIQLNELPEGIYFVQVISKDTKIVKRIVLDR